jgi:uncharacterized protein YecT (DUF1311 family)
MKLASGLVTVMIATSSFGGFCQQPSANPCDNPKTTIEMRECAAFKLKNAEKDLEQVYSTMLSKLSDEAHKKSLRASQEAWQKYRDAAAEFEGYFYKGGTIQLQIKLDCMTRMTQARAKELRQLLKDEFDH